LLPYSKYEAWSGVKNVACFAGHCTLTDRRTDTESELIL
jgi:hypothetical protein